MSDDLPTAERLRRIERGVQRRIDRRRQVAQRIAGASVAVVLVVGGFALVRPALTFSGGSSASSAGGTSGGSQRTTAVVCHDATATRTVRVAAGRLPGAAIAACSTAMAAGAPSARPNAVDGTSTSTRTPTPLPTPVLCETASGVLHVYLTSPASCAAHGQDPVDP